MEKLAKVILCLFFTCAIYGQEIKINEVRNSIVYGPAIGNRDLAFGIKNILEELVQDQGYYLSEKGKPLDVELIYFGAIRKTTNVALYTKKVNEVELVAIAKYGKKKVKVSAKAQDVSIAKIILNNDGNFTQSTVSSVIKKMCEQIISKLKL